LTAHWTESGGVEETVVVRIEVDTQKCRGYGNCVFADTEHFDIGDDGLVVVLREDVAPEESASVAAAARSCPARAISLPVDEG
jgi:ferredoxin